MKKIILLLVLFLGFCSLSHAEVGVGLWGGVIGRKSNLKEVSNDFNSYPNLFGVEFLWEYNAEIDALGIKIGYAQMGKTEGGGNYAYGSWNTKIETYEIPITLYYKYKLTPALHLIGGIGVGIFQFDYETTESYYSYYGWQTHTWSNDKAVFVPHVNFAAEWRINRYFALGIDGKYNFGKKKELEFGETMQIRGLQIGAIGRFYF